MPTPMQRLHQNKLILDKMNSTIDDLDLSPEANAAATATMSSYASAITSAGANAVAAAQSIASQVSAALSSANTTISIGVNGSIPGHATGTTNAEDVFIAGENGPELVVGQSGSTVFPASETNRIISALHGMDGTSYGDTYENTTNSRTEVVNNYNTVENNSSYDDERILYLLSGFITMLSSIEGKMDQHQEPAAIVLDAYASGTTDSSDSFIAGENGPELIVGRQESTVFPATETERIITALTDTDISGELAAMTNSIQPAGDEISNYDQSITYGDAPDYSHEYQTDYGDRIFNDADSFEDDHSSLTTNTATTYEDNSRRLSTALTEGDRAYAENSNVNSYGTAYENAFRYGDRYQSVAEGTQYEDTTQTIGGDQTVIHTGDTDNLYSTSTALSSQLTDDHSSLTSNTATTYEDNSRRLSTSLSEAPTMYRTNTSYEVANRSGDEINRAFDTVTNYGDTIQSHTETTVNPEDSTHSFEDASYTVFFPLLPLFEAIMERALTSSLDAPQAYFDRTDEFTDTASVMTEPEFEMPELFSTLPTENVENPIVGFDEDGKPTATPESSSTPAAAGKEESTKRIIIEIAGSGEIDVSGGISSDDVLELLQDNLKPVLMSIIQTEMYEEGDGAYDY